jgi:hypothetical protein
MNKLLKPVSLLALIFSILVFRLLVLPGLSFNQNIWDDEIGWMEDSNDRSTLDYIVYRDAPGYFVFVPRIIILISKINPTFDSISTLRFLVLVIQILCFSAAVACVVNFRANWKFFLLAYSSLLITYVEDLNYLHNVGYIFVFPILYLVFKPVWEGKPLTFWRIGLGAILVSKPFTAVLIVVLVFLFMSQKTAHVRKLLLFGCYCLFYLGTYILLPNRWETPFNDEFFTILKLVINLPWILFSTLLPVISIGGLGLLNLLKLDILAWVLGVTVYVFLLIVVFRFRHAFYRYITRASLLTKSLLIMFISSYLLVYSASDSYWIKFFPLFLFDAPQFIWTRWSSILPFLVIMLIASANSLGIRFRRYIILGVASQWIILFILAYPRLRRYW